MTTLNFVLLCATLICMAVAVFAEMRRRRAVPKLKLTLDSDTGTTNVTGSGKQGRYFILNVTNKNTLVPAVDVKVHVVRMATSPDRAKWTELPINGPVQVSWRRPADMPDIVKVGSGEQCTVLRVHQGDGSIEIPTIGQVPNNFRNMIQPSEFVRVTIKARADNATSKPLTLQVHWTGKWAQGDNVAKDLNVQVV